MKKVSVIVFIIGLILGQSFPATAEVLSRDDFINSAIKNNPQYQISTQAYLSALAEYNNTQSLEDWNLISSGFASGASNSPDSGFNATYQQTLGYSVGVEKYFAKTGTALQITHNNTRINADFPAVTIPGLGTLSFFPSSPYYNSNVSIALVQPLMKNAFGLATKNALKMSAYSLELASINLGEDWENFIVTLDQDYCGWQQTRANVATYQSKVNKVNDQVSQVEKQERYGLSEESDLVQLKQKLNAYEIMLEGAKMADAAQTARIKLMINNLSADLSPEDFSCRINLPTEEEGLQYLEQSSNLNKATEILVALQKTGLETQTNALLPEVNLVLEAKPSAFTYGFTDSLSRIGEYSQYTLSVSASRGLANAANESNKKKAEADYAKALKERENILLNAKIALEALYSNLASVEKMITLQQESVTLATKNLELEQTKYRQGRSSIFFILQAEDSLLAAESSLSETKFNQAALVRQIKSLTDRYLVEYQEVLKL
ncbi:MAG: TolC family protein [bacterium]